MVKQLSVRPHAGFDRVETTFIVNILINSEPEIRCGNEDSRGTKTENHKNIYFPWKEMDKHTFFSMKIKMMDL